MPLMKLSAQCYTVRDDIERDLWGTLAAMRSLGLNYIEIGGTFGVEAKEFEERLGDIGLEVSANHANLAQLTTAIDAVIEENLAVGSRAVILSSVGKDLYGQGWATVARTLEPIGARLKEVGLGFGYHNHAFEFALEGGRPGLDILYETADPTLLTAQIDTYWAAYGGADPAAYIRKVKGRVPHVHLKDGILGGEPHFVEVGQGELKWQEILDACQESGVEFGAIELDICPRQPLESLKMSVDYLRGSGAFDA
jgi:sugar phosphate isomerase/epimerase